MQPYQERVISEKAELDEKLAKLSLFVAGKMFGSLPEDEQSRMRRQQNAMLEYSTALGERIAAFQ